MSPFILPLYKQKIIASSNYCFFRFKLVKIFYCLYLSVLFYFYSLLIYCMQKASLSLSFPQLLRTTPLSFSETTLQPFNHSYTSHSIILIHQFDWKIKLLLHACKSEISQYFCSNGQMFLRIVKLKNTYLDFYQDFFIIYTYIVIGLCMANGGKPICPGISLFFQCLKS